MILLTEGAGSLLRGPTTIRLKLFEGEGEIDVKFDLQMFNN